MDSSLGWQCIQLTLMGEEIAFNLWYSWAVDISLQQSYWHTLWCISSSIPTSHLGLIFHYGLIICNFRYWFHAQLIIYRIFINFLSCGDDVRSIFVFRWLLHFMSASYCFLSSVLDLSWFLDSCRSFFSPFATSVLPLILICMNFVFLFVFS